MRKAWCGSDHLSRAIAPPPAGERIVRSTILSRTAPQPRAFLRSAWPCAQAFTLPVGRARGAPCKTVCTRSVSYPSALPLARGLRRNRQRIAFALPEGTSPRRPLANGQPSPCLWPVRTQFCSARPVRTPKEEQCFAQGLALPKTRRPQDRAEKGLRSSLSFPSCAHHRKSKCFAQGKALPKTRRPQDRAEKGLRSSLSFPSCAHQRKSNASHKA